MNLNPKSDQLYIEVMNYKIKTNNFNLISNKFKNDQLQL